MEVKECKVCGEVPVARMEKIDNIELHDLVCGDGVCCSVDGAFAARRTIEHWNAIQDTKDEEELNKVAKFYKDLGGHGIYQRATPILGMEKNEFKLKFKEDYYKPLSTVEFIEVKDKIPVDDEQPENLLLEK